MGVTVSQCLIFVFSMTILGIQSLKEIEVNIPLGVKINETITLQCKYDLEGEPLYTVKWYKGSREFYRFIPKELPNTKVFPISGIEVDVSKSTPNEVVLQRVQPEVTGKYKCEVSSDAPHFDTKSKSGYMYVLTVPMGDPTIVVDRTFVDIGEYINANCTTQPSFPATNVSWFLNGKKVSPKFSRTLNVSQTSSKSKQSVTVSDVEIHINEDTFQNGKAKLSCVATLFNIYRGESNEILEETKPRPKPSSVTGPRDDRSAGSQQLVVPTSGILISLLFNHVYR